MPAPPSVVALPPTPSTMVRAPASSAARSSSPVPYVVAVSGAKIPGGSRRSPEASAISTTAVPSRSAYAASTVSPIGPVTRTVRRSNPAATAASTVPSPPSATGSSVTSRPGTTERSPAATCAATCTAVSEPLNLSAAISTRPVEFPAVSDTFVFSIRYGTSRRFGPYPGPAAAPIGSALRDRPNTARRRVARRKLAA